MSEEDPASTRKLIASTVSSIDPEEERVNRNTSSVVLHNACCSELEHESFSLWVSTVI